ncbi:uncharacterized protein G2W53_040640 [Senna tora]|uniref:Uncharacterized protein n=1 Tax=Senna tora TaxID=362788 RepID=A0A834W264_9FABA|nr:uncharacterized protein G2W53_040640 [Senna tora]
MGSHLFLIAAVKMVSPRPPSYFVVISFENSFCLSSFTMFPAVTNISPSIPIDIRGPPSQHQQK